MKKNIFLRFISLLLFLLLLFSLSACGGGERAGDNRVFYGCFDTVCVVWDYSGMDGDDFTALAEDIEKSANYYHRLFDAYGEYDGVTNIATLNRLAGTGAVKVDRAIIDLLSFSEEMYDTTGGRVNFALGAVTYLWKTLPLSQNYDGSSKTPRIPTDAELAEAGKHISPDSVVIDKENLTVEITDPELRIDVGAIAKGYTAELIKRELVALGYEKIILDFGGNICAVGIEKEIPIRNPLYSEDEDEPYIRYSLVKSESLVTSGVYERNFVVDGVSYHHIIDPTTLRPEARYLSVSVKTAHSGEADALSTAFFNMDTDEIEDLLRRINKRMEITLVLGDGSVKIIEN